MDKKNPSYAVNKLTALAATICGDTMPIGIRRIIDGKCPDCGSLKHDNDERCYVYADDEPSTPSVS